MLEDDILLEAIESDFESAGLDQRRLEMLRYATKLTREPGNMEKADVDRLREGQGPCLYVANHASWLDIPVLCTVLDPVFKFIAKGELGQVPCIGQQLNGVRMSVIVTVCVMHVCVLNGLMQSFP